MAVLGVRFQTNDKPWSTRFGMSEVEGEWRKRLKPFEDELRLRRQGRLPGPYRRRDEAISRGVKLVMSQTSPGLVAFISNRNGKGVRAHVVADPNPFGPIFPTVGACRDDYPNIVYRQNAAGQLVKLQSPAMGAYLEAERLNRRPIRITGEGWRSCALQSQLYHSDPGRFANPDDSRHCRGLALDIENTPQNLSAQTKARLVAVGFIFGVAGEPWHCAYLEAG